LKPSDIESKTFSTALRGYDLNEVDDFLDEVITALRDLEAQVAEAASSAKQVDPTPQVPDESAVGRVLIAAQNTADQILEEARAEADRIKEEAKVEADAWTSERETKRAEAEQHIAELRLRVDNVRRELAVLATVVADGLDEMDASIDSADRATGLSGTADEEDVLQESEDDGEPVDGEYADDGEDEDPDGDLTEEVTAKDAVATVLEESGADGTPSEDTEPARADGSQEVNTTEDGLIVEVDDSDESEVAERVRSD
jgi:cell division initiation protein